MNNDKKYIENENILERLGRAVNEEMQNGLIKKKFLSLPTIAEKVFFVNELLEMNDVSPTFVPDFKDNNKSSALRAKGNKFYSSKKDEEALEMYTYSIAFAENISENLGLAFANRSAVLFRLGFFQECLRDIEYALENNYPKSLLHKIEERRTNALNSKLKQKKIEYHCPIPTINEKDKNPLIESASSCVEIKNDSNQGRFLVATRDIRIGEIIVVERPTFTVLTDMKWCHCYHCLTLCYNLLPCKSCTKALFCSVECRTEANYHKYECPILATIESLGYNSCRNLPLRIAISMRENYENLGKELEKSDVVYKSGRYKEIHNLVTNEKFRTVSDLFERAACTAIFFKLLKERTNIFVENCAFEVFFVQLVFQHLQTMACNFHDVSEMSENSYGIYEYSDIGAGAYGFLSLFNHSCAPNVCRTSYGTSILVSAVETIRKGEQLFDNYGFHFAIQPKSLRQSSLKKQYYFDCTCRACTQNWNTVLNLKHKGGPIPFDEYREDLAKADMEVAKKIRPDVIKALRSLEKDIPCFEFCQVQEILKQCDGIFGSLRKSLNSDSSF